MRVDNSSCVFILAANAPYFRWLREAVDSIRDKPQGAGVSIVVFDLGFTPEQQRELLQRSVLLTTPGWDYSFYVPHPEWFKAMTARTNLPKWVPGYDFYFWLDADAWVQRWDAVEDLIEGARRYGFACVPEADRAYNDICAKTKNGDDLVSIETRAANLEKFFGANARKKLRRFPCLNCGVFAASAMSPIWEAWPKLMEAALRRNAANDNFFAEQTAMNVALLSGAVSFARLPATHNWLVSNAWPKVGANDELVHPEFPHEPIGIVHRASITKNMDARLWSIDGKWTNVGIGYRSNR